MHNVDGVSRGNSDVGQAGGLLAPAVSDESNTQLSSSSGSVKPPSLDGKSVASGTTFALDEKESLRPDDSASVNAIEDEDTFATVPVLQSSRNGIEYGSRAFGDQLREISAMQPSRQGVAPQPYGPPPTMSKGVLYVPPPGPGVGVVNPAEEAKTATSMSAYPPDPKLLEALESPRDRLMVMKLQTDIVDFIGDAKEQSLTLPQCNAYHRMLAHKAADYYMLGHVVDDLSSGVRLFKTPNTCLRPPLIDTTTPSTAASTPPPNAPQMKILRRGMDSAPAIVNGSTVTSKSGSENGEDDDKKSKTLTREEREARYEAVRLRIMGPNKAGSPEAPKPQDSSRSSSAAGKKSQKKKQRSDSEDGFEARSAYSAFYPNGAPANNLGYQASHGEASQYTPLSREGFRGAFQPYVAQSQPNIQWAGIGYPSVGTPQSPYDLAQDFQRMSFQNAAVPQPSHMQTGYNNYQQQYYGAQQPWSQQGYQSNAQPMQGSGSFYGGYSGQSASPYVQEMPMQPYQYGQLPSQTFPGRPANKLEHPLPGSYKGKHFNPQSQAFIPTQQSSSGFQSAQPGSGSASPYAMGSPLHSAHGQGSAFGSPRHTQAAPTPSNAQAQPLLHPLPQPVFPRQPSPSLPLPPKPTPQQPGTQQHMAPPAQTTPQTPSSLAKWGTPASLPAKPPPPAQPFDGAKFSQLQRQASYGSAAAARVPSFGSMPPMSVSGGGMHRQ